MNTDWRVESLRARDEMRKLNRSLDEVYLLTKQWLMMSGLVYIAVDNSTRKITHAFGSWWKLGYQPGDLVGKDFTEYVHPEDYAGAVEAHKTWHDGSRYGTEISVRHRWKCYDGTYSEIGWKSEGSTSVGNLNAAAGEVYNLCGSIKDDE